MTQFQKKTGLIRSKTVTNLCSLVVLAGLAVPASVVAQQSSSAETPPDLQEIIVTARRRSETLESVPIAITAIGKAEIQEQEIRSDSDLQAAVPGLTIRQTQGNNSLTYSIRGQSADTFSGSPSAVVSYVNEVPVAVGGASSFYDLESIQVLKGPQGTLFGRNTTGGAVLYTAAKPTEDLEGMLQLRTGNLDLREAIGMINVPLVDDQLLMRIAFDTIDRDGYVDNLVTGNKQGKIGRDSGRISLTWRPSERLENTAMFGYTDINSTNTGASYTYSVYTPFEEHNGYALNSASGFLFGPGLDFLFGPGAWDAYLAEHPYAYAPGLAAYVDEQKRLGNYKTQYPFSTKHTGHDWIFTNHTTFELTDNIQIRNIIGASDSSTRSEQPALGAPYLTFATRNLATGKAGNESDAESISEELQITGEALGGDLTYIAGVFIQRQKTDTLWPQSYFELSPWMDPALLIPFFTTNHFRIETDSEAIYAQGTYSFTEQLRLTAGFRYTEEDVKIKQLAESAFYQVPGYVQNQDDKFSKPSWEVGVEYDWSDTVFTYVKTRGSFRSGGFNGSALPVDTDATGGGNKFDPETVKDVELGVKYYGSLFDRPARMNLAVYKTWIDDVQRIEFPVPPGYTASIAVTANVPKMEVKGVEWEGSFMPCDWVELGLMGAYTDASFEDNEVVLFGTTYQYSPVANTPEWTGRAWAQISLPIDSYMGDLSLYTEYYAQSNMYFSNTADSVTPQTKLPSYELLNARFNWSNIMESGFSAAVFGKNILDKDHFVGGMPLGASLGHNAAAVGEPRTYGLELTYQF